MKVLKRCPVCNSRKFHGFKGRYKCGNCGKIWISSAVQETDNDGGLINPIQSSSIPQYNADLHNIVLKFPIIKDSVVDWPRQEGFKGFIQVTTYKAYQIKKTKNWLIIYNNKRINTTINNLEKAYDLEVQKLTQLAIEISQRYNFEIDKTPLSFSRNRPEVKLDFLASNNFYEAEAKSVYPSPSPIELIGKNSINNSMNLTMMLTDLRNSIMLEIENKKMHQKVLEDIRENIKKNNELVVQIYGKEKEGMSSFQIEFAKSLNNLLNSAIKIRGAIE